MIIEFTFPVPKSYPSTVGLAKQYVQILMTGLQTTIIQNLYPIDRMFESIPTIVQAINIPRLIVPGNSPAQLLFGFPPGTTGFGRPAAWDKIVLAAVASVISQAPERTIYDKGLWGVDFTIRLTCLDQSRNLACFHSLKHVIAIEIKEGKGERLQVGDLVLFYSFEVDKHKGKKLEEQWEEL